VPAAAASWHPLFNEQRGKLADTPDTLRCDDALDLPAVIHLAVILAPCRFLRVSDQVSARDVVMKQAVQ
jgi:hypothetical protein